MRPQMIIGLSQHRACCAVASSARIEVSALGTSVFDDPMVFADCLGGVGLYVVEHPDPRPLLPRSQRSNWQPCIWLGRQLAGMDVLYRAAGGTSPRSLQSGPARSVRVS